MPNSDQNLPPSGQYNGYVAPLCAPPRNQIEPPPPVPHSSGGSAGYVPPPSAPPRNQIKPPPPVQRSSGGSAGNKHFKEEIRKTIHTGVEYQTGTMMQCGVFLHLLRFCTGRVYELKLTKREVSELGNMNPIPRVFSGKWLCWRRSVLAVANLFFVLMIIQMWTSWSYAWDDTNSVIVRKRCEVLDVWNATQDELDVCSEWPWLIPNVTAEAPNPNKPLNLKMLRKALQLPVLEQLRKITIMKQYCEVVVILCKMGGLVLSAMAQFAWKDPDRSINYLRYSFGLNCGPTFLIPMFIPFRTLADRKEMQRDLCNVAMFSPWGIRSRLTPHVHSKLPSDFCLQPPSKWPQLLQDTLYSAGAVTKTEGQACLRAESLVDEFDINKDEPLAASENSNCSSSGSCAGCYDNTACPSHLLAQASAWSHMTSIKGPASEMTTSLTKVQQCAQACPLSCFAQCTADKNFQSRLLQSLPAENPIKDHFENQASWFSYLCHSKEDMSTLEGDMEDMGQLVEEGILYVLGVTESTQCLGILLPAVFSVIFGMLRGVRLARLAVPYSRLTGYVVGAALLFTVPPIMALLAVANNIWGDGYFVCVCIFVVLQLLVYLPHDWMQHLPCHSKKRMANVKKADTSASGNQYEFTRNMLEPAGHKEATYQFRIRDRYLFVCYSGIGLFAIIFIVSNPIIFDAVVWAVTQSDFLLGLAVTGQILRLIGEASVATLVFADAFLQMLVCVWHGDLNDHTRVKVSRNFMLDDLCSIHTKVLGNPEQFRNADSTPASWRAQPENKGNCIDIDKE